VSRRVVITGALGGIGRACVTAFRDAGWVVGGIGHRPPDPDLPMEHYASIDFAGADLGTRFEAFLREFGGVDALVNNAAINISKPLVETTDEEWARTLAINVTAAFVTMRTAYSYLRDSRGAIVNVNSVHAFATSRGAAAYAASKGAVLALTRAAALELGPDGIRVNAVIPGAIDTPMLHKATNARFGTDRPGSDPVAGIAARTPLGRIGRPDEIANVVLFLADGELSSFVTGAAFTADGGVLARLASE
jgi:NAD(P)-dependent dehydrogenase (short-subunit alcohol dehydrogenase family)